MALEDTQNLVTSQEADLWHALGVAQLDADLRGRETFTGELDDHLYYVVGRRLEPCGRRAFVRERRGRWASLSERRGDWRRGRRGRGGGDVQMPLPGACMRPILALNTR